MTAIKVEGVCKSYKGITALQDISLDIRSGEIFGLIGPDGAGKTSLFRILTTLTLPDAGKAAVNGKDVVADYEKIRSTIGYMPGHFALYQDLSVEENLKFYATVFGTTVEENYDNIKEIYSQIEMFKDRKAGNLSGGMKQKLALCCALVHKPEVLFLDEPTTGVDAVSRKEFWAMLARIKASGVTIMVSTPYMDEASLCDRIALILNGKIIDRGTPGEIVSRYPDTLYAVKDENMFRILNVLRQLDGVLGCSSFGCECHVSVSQDGPDGGALGAALEASGLHGCTVERIRPGIEDCFIKLS
ncbi:MAG: ABC transporter ATP-binding protein [Bacteroidales bacterium]|nr:ABC transporter ATP-binding protein [Bacteroidales bacterium]